MDLYNETTVYFKSLSQKRILQDLRKKNILYLKVLILLFLLRLSTSSYRRSDAARSTKFWNSSNFGIDCQLHR
jgi:hypothetical protein